MKKLNQEPSKHTTSAHTHIIFVYGTLRQGEGNHYMLNSSRFLGIAKTKSLYALYASGIPFLSRTSAVSQVIGEVYEVEHSTLIQLDILEGHPDCYRREIAEVVLLEDSTILNAWIYFFDNPRGKLIASGDFLQEAPRRSHHSV